MSVAHRFTWLFGLQSLTELKACSQLKLYHCAIQFHKKKVSLRLFKEAALCSLFWMWLYYILLRNVLFSILVYSWGLIFSKDSDQYISPLSNFSRTNIFVFFMWLTLESSQIKVTYSPHDMKERENRQTFFVLVHMAKFVLWSFNISKMFFPLVT